MSTIDFVTALGRLLRDRDLRDAFARDPSAVAERFNLCGCDREAFSNLSPAQLEVQARVLVRKRFRKIVGLLPITCQELGPESWELFQKYARRVWPTIAAADAVAFCEWLRAGGTAFTRREYNRVRFLAGDKRAAFHLVSSSARFSTPSGQILLRRGGRVSEYELRFGW